MTNKFKLSSLFALVSMTSIALAGATTRAAWAEEAAPAATATEKTPEKTEAPADGATAENAEKAEKPAKKEKKTVAKPAAASGTAKSAVIKTTVGEITVKFFGDKTPKTVANFVGLATGKKEWTDPRDGKVQKGKPLYNGTIFHRVIPDFMIQGGDPLGNGTGSPGGPGFPFEDEFTPSDSFDKPGILAMANSGPNTNGSQFFITVKPTPWLNGRHTIFGEVTKGMDVVEKIVSTPRGPMDRPSTPIKIEKITVKN
jgi:peptidyl-prolyl cis-trans isomerase A (cyclophilin A)